MTPRAKAVDWGLALLTQDPFPEVPPRSPDEAIWAGMKELKANIERHLAVGVTTAASQVILNWGPYGSGKTHAAVYYGSQEKMPKTKGPRVREVVLVRVTTPKDAAEAERIFFRDILEAIQFRRIRSSVSELIRQTSEDDALLTLQESLASEALGKAMWLLGHERKAKGQMSLFGDEGMSDDWNRLLEAYFHGQTTKTDLKTLGLSRGMDTSQDRARVLAGVAQSIIGFAPTDEIASHRRLILWIDELEDLLYFTSRQYRPFTQGIRDLIDRLPSYFTLMMNFTLASPELQEDATALFGAAIMDRVTANIYFREPTKEEAFDYAVDVMRHYRTAEFARFKVPSSFPFEESALKSLIEMLDRRTPRSINKRCAQIAMRALEDGVISAEKRHLIDRGYIDKVQIEEVETEEA